MYIYLFIINNNVRSLLINISDTIKPAQAACENEIGKYFKFCIFLKYVETCIILFTKNS